MEEVIKILGSLNEWIMWSNLTAIIVMGWYIQGVYREIETINKRINKINNKFDRLTGKVVQMAKRVYGKKDNLFNTDEVEQSSTES